MTKRAASAPTSIGVVTLNHPWVIVAVTFLVAGCISFDRDGVWKWVLRDFDGELSAPMIVMSDLVTAILLAYGVTMCSLNPTSTSAGLPIGTFLGTQFLVWTMLLFVVVSSRAKLEAACFDASVIVCGVVLFVLCNDVRNQIKVKTA